MCFRPDCQPLPENLFGFFCPLRSTRQLEADSITLLYLQTVLHRCIYKQYYIAVSTNITYDTPIKPALLSFTLENHYFPSIFHSSCGLKHLCINPQHHTVPLKCFLLYPVNITSVIKLMNGITPTEK